MMLNVDHNRKDKSRDRVLVLRPKEGMKQKTNTGLVDSSLFAGQNTVHLISDPQTSLWSFKIDRGVLHEPLRRSFTSYKAIYDYAVEYFDKRNIEIKEVLD